MASVACPRFEECPAALRCDSLERSIDTYEISLAGMLALQANVNDLPELDEAKYDLIAGVIEPVKETLIAEHESNLAFGKGKKAPGISENVIAQAEEAHELLRILGITQADHAAYLMRRDAITIDDRIAYMERVIMAAKGVVDRYGMATTAAVCQSGPVLQTAEDGLSEQICGSPNLPDDLRSISSSPYFG